MRTPRVQRNSRLILVSGVAAVCFLFPIVNLPSHPILILGIPPLYAYLFTVWLVVIIATYLLVRKTQ